MDEMRRDELGGDKGQGRKKWGTRNIGMGKQRVKRSKTGKWSMMNVYSAVEKGK